MGERSNSKTIFDVLDNTYPKISFDESDPLRSQVQKQQYEKLLGNEHIGAEESEEFKLVENSVPLTIFLLVNTMIGSGILNQPFVFREAGIFGSLLGYLFASTLTWLGLNFLTAAGEKSGIFEYGQIAKHALGDTGEWMIDIAITVGAFGSILGYILIVGSTISDLLQSWGCHNDVCGIYFTSGISIALFVTPVCLFRHFGHLAWLSIFSIFAIVCVIFLVFIGGPLLSKSGSLNYFSAAGTSRSIGSIVFSLSCASANFQAYITTEKPARNRVSWFKITSILIGIGGTLLVCMGLAGYLSFKGETDGIILDNFHGHQFDFFKAMVAVHIILYIPTNLIIMRYSIVKMWLKRKSEDLPYSMHAALTVTLLAICTISMLMFIYSGLSSGDAFSIILNITGGISGSITSYLLPSMIAMKLLDKSDWLHTAARVEFVLGIAIMISVTANTILEYV